MTFLTDLDNLIKHKHGDVKKLREIRDTIRHDNFITTEDKNYTQSLIDEHLKNQPLETPSPRRQSSTKIKLEAKSKAKRLDSPSNFTFDLSSSKNIGILGGGAAAAVLAIIVLVGFPAIDQSDITNSSIISTPNNPLLVTIDQSNYQRADIISISGDTTSDRESISLSILNNNGVKIWNEDIDPKRGGNFSTLVIAGGGGWEKGGSYTIKAVQSDLIKEIKFQFIE